MRGVRVRIFYPILLGLVGGLAVLLMGFLLPYRLLEAVWARGANPWLNGPLSALSIIVAGVLGFFALVFMVPLLEAVREEGRETYTAYRARQRAMLEELDEIVRVLEEIRDILRSAGG